MNLNLLSLFFALPDWSSGPVWLLWPLVQFFLVLFLSACPSRGLLFFRGSQRQCQRLFTGPLPHLLIPFDIKTQASAPQEPALPYRQRPDPRTWTRHPGCLSLDSPPPGDFHSLLGVLQCFWKEACDISITICRSVVQKGV